MRFSVFSSFGMLRFSSKPSAHQSVYESMRAGLGGDDAYDLSVGTYAEAKLFATSHAIARGKRLIEHAQAQHTPSTAYELIAAAEKDYRVAPAANDRIRQRRARLAGKQLLSQGAVRTNIENALLQILGADFLAYRVFDPATEVTTAPSTPGTVGNFVRGDVPARVVGILDATPIGTCTVRYQNWDTTQADVLLRVGDSLCVQAENQGLAEHVTVSAIAGAGASRTFTATFAKGHDVGASATTGPAPIWWSTRRTALIIVTATKALNLDVRRRIDDTMGRLARGVSQWAIVQPSSPGETTVGPFVLNASPLGAVPIGSLSF